MSPTEIEALLVKHPSIKEAAVIGVPTISGSDLLRAFVVQEEGCNLTKEDVSEFVSGYCMRQEIYIWFSWVE